MDFMQLVENTLNSTFEKINELPEHHQRVTSAQAEIIIQFDIAQSLRKLAGQRDPEPMRIGVGANMLGGVLWRLARENPSANGGIDFHQVAKRLIEQFDIREQE